MPMRQIIAAKAFDTTTMGTSIELRTIPTNIFKIRGLELSILLHENMHRSTVKLSPKESWEMWRKLGKVLLRNAVSRVIPQE